MAWGCAVFPLSAHVKAFRQQAGHAQERPKYVFKKWRNTKVSSTFTKVVGFLGAKPLNRRRHKTRCLDMPSALTWRGVCSIIKEDRKGGVPMDRERIEDRKSVV